MRYILTGGGTGGHVYPALAIAEHIKKNEPDAEFLYIGTKDHIESRIVPSKGYRMKYISAVGMPDKKLSIAMFLFVLKIFWGTLKSLFIVLFFRPDMIIGSGGFVSAPPIFAGYMLRKLKLSKTKLFLHEANAEPGKLIKLAGPLCDGVGVSYEIALNLFPSNGKFVGYPVRPEFFTGSKLESRKKLGIADETFLVFAVGGSQGARTINRAVADSLSYLSGLKDFSIIHVTGRQNPSYNGYLDTIKRLEMNALKESELSFYKKIEYADNIKDYYFAADIIITRGGGTINEIAVCGTPSLIIPKANLSGDHQVMNALSMKNSGAAEVIYEEVMIEDGKFFIKVEGRKLADKIIGFYNNKDLLKKMSDSAKNSVVENANEEIYRFVRDIFNNVKTERQKIKIHQANKYADMGVKQIFNSLHKMKPDEISSLEFLDYIKYRASHYLISNNWKVKNTAVKISGLTRDESKLPFLSKLLNDKNAGFVKRNIMCAYREIGIYNEMIESDIFTALNDPYWEVQTEALKCVNYFKEETKQNDKIRALITGLLKRGNYEVVLNAISAYSVYIRSAEDLNEFDQFNYHNNSHIREAVITVLSSLKKEGKITTDQFKAKLDNILLTTTGFTPVFSMKQKLKEAN